MAGKVLTYGDSAHVHAVTAFGSASYGYDADGCTINRSAQTIRYDPERRPVRVDENGVTQWRATYDGDGARRKRLDGKGTIHHVGPYERSVGNGQDVTEVVTKCYTAGMGGMSRLIAMRKNGVLAWVGTDHLGGTIRVADASFSPLGQMRYTPFGVDRDPGTHLNTDHKFTSQIEDESIGLYWYASRAYDPSIGRFCQPDEVVPCVSNPQAMNRYSYGLNDPFKHADPTGHNPVVAAMVLAGAALGGAAAFIVAYRRESERNPGKEDWGGIVTATVAGAGAGALMGGLGGVGAVMWQVSLRTAGGVVLANSGVTGASTVVGSLVGGEDLRTSLISGAVAAGGSAIPVFEPVAGKLPMKEMTPNLWKLAGRGGWDSFVGTVAGSKIGDDMKKQEESERIRRADPSQVDSVYRQSQSVSVEPLKMPQDEITDWMVSGSIPADVAPGGVGVINITFQNRSGEPANGGSWDSPGGANAQEDAAARRAAWERAGSSDYNRPKTDSSGNITGYYSVYE